MRDSSAAAAASGVGGGWLTCVRLQGAQGGWKAWGEDQQMHGQWVLPVLPHPHAVLLPGTALGGAMRGSRHACQLCLSYYTQNWPILPLSAT